MNTKYVALVLVAVGGAAASAAPAGHGKAAVSKKATPTAKKVATANTSSGGKPRGVITGDDYPSAWKLLSKDAFATVFGFNRECVSFAAWKIYENSGGRKVPTDRNPPSDWASYSINVDADWGNASRWSAYAAAQGVQKDQRPTVGSVAQWNVHPEIGMTVGHVGIVKAVNSDGSIDIEQYNLREDGKYSVLHMRKNSSAVDQSNGHRSWTVPWPDNFIHFHGR